MLAQMLTSIVDVYVTELYVSKRLCGTDTKSNWNWMQKYADRDI